MNRRSWFSFAALFAFLIAFAWLWNILLHNQVKSEQPRAFRSMLEFNGRIWKALSNPTQLNVCSPPAHGQIPRVNGQIGMDDHFDPSQWTMQVVTNEEDPGAKVINLTMTDIQRLPRTETSSHFYCIEGWSEDMSFAGVKFSDFMQAYGLKPKRYVGLESVGGEYYVSIDMESMLHPQTLLAYEMNGDSLKLANGAPLRLVIPVKYGIKNLKRIGKIFFSNSRPPDYWAEQGYDWYAGL